jgi:hypothetical protein
MFMCMRMSIGVRLVRKCLVVETGNNAIWVPRLPGLPAPPFAIFSITLHDVSHLSHVLTISPQSQVINILRQGKYKYSHDSIDESFTLHTAPT